jgi:hypothetical protein
MHKKQLHPVGLPLVVHRNRQEQLMTSQAANRFDVHFPDSKGESGNREPEGGGRCGGKRQSIDIDARRFVVPAELEGH